MNATTKRYDVLRIDPSHGPVYVLVPAIESGDDDSRTFAYEEHDCPSDILARCEIVIAGGDADPHHIIDFVKAITVDWDYPCSAEEVLKAHIPEAFEKTNA